MGKFGGLVNTATAEKSPWKFCGLVVRVRVKVRVSDRGRVRGKRQIYIPGLVTRKEEPGFRKRVI